MDDHSARPWFDLNGINNNSIPLWLYECQQGAIHQFVLITTQVVVISARILQQGWQWKIRLGWWNWSVFASDDWIEVQMPWQRFSYTCWYDSSLFLVAVICYDECGVTNYCCRCEILPVTNAPQKDASAEEWKISYAHKIRSKKKRNNGVMANGSLPLWVLSFGSHVIHRGPYAIMALLWKVNSCAQFDETTPSLS